MTVAVAGVLQGCGDEKPVYVGEYCPENGCSEEISSRRVLSVANNLGETCAPEVTVSGVEVTIDLKTGEGTTEILEPTTLYLSPDSCELLEE